MKAAELRAWELRAIDAVCRRLYVKGYEADLAGNKRLAQLYDAEWNAAAAIYARLYRRARRSRR